MKTVCLTATVVVEVPKDRYFDPSDAELGFMFLRSFINSDPFPTVEWELYEDDDDDSDEG